MPKNKGKGGKNHKKGKNKNETDAQELVFKEDGQEYAMVTKVLGAGRVEAICVDGKVRLCHIRGKMYKRIWISVGDLILIGLREYQDYKADVIFKYSPDEARNLKTYGELPENMRVPELTTTHTEEEDTIVFADHDSASDNEKVDGQLLNDLENFKLY